MKTYCLIMNNSRELASLTKQAKHFYRKGFRILISLEDDVQVPERYIVKKIQGAGQTVTDKLMPWMKSTLLDELVQEPPRSTLKQAIKKWEDAVKRIKKAEDDLHKAMHLELEVQKELVRANGAGPLVYQGETWDPVPRVNRDGQEFVRYQRRMTTPNKLDTV